jgi:hypothetical protein
VADFVKIEPRRVRLAGRIGEAIAADVTITPIQPFRILEAKTDPGINVRAHLLPAKNGSYLLSIENTSTVVLNYSEMIVLRTDHRDRPEITIPVMAALQQ